MAGRRGASDRDGEEASRLHEEVARLRDEAARLGEEIASLRAQVSRAKGTVAAAFVGPDLRMDQLREANEKLVLATIHAQTMNEAAQLANQQKGEFLAMLAHELRNPLAPIVNALAILRRIPAGEEPRLPWVHDVMKRQVDHLTQLLNDLLEVSRITSGKVVLKKRPVPIAEIMNHAMEAVRPLVRVRHQHLALDIPPHPLMVDGDPTRLVQIFANLLNNAAKYTPERGSITFSARQDGKAVVLRVMDNGCGIAADALAHIFELFTQEGRSLARAQGGLGIGLTVVRSLVELHGGTVDASSRGLGKGSEFAVSIPLMRSPPAVVARGNESKSAAPSPSYRIVLIEDNVDANETLKAVLEMSGHEVHAAFDGNEGLELILQIHPQIVLCDIGLPGLSGYQLIARLRETPGQPMPLMIALTGYGLSEDRARTLETGFDHHLTKPVDVEALLELIAKQGPRPSP